MGTYIDTRDLYKQQCELQSELDDLQEVITDLRNCLDEDYPDVDIEDKAQDFPALEEWRTACAELSDWRDEYQEELDELNNLETEIGPEWMHGETLIPVEDFEEYAEQLAEDIGAVSSGVQWPLTHIDWDAAAADLLQDYSECEYDSSDYYFRMS